jgi:hypothetical protein
LPEQTTTIEETTIEETTSRGRHRGDDIEGTVETRTRARTKEAPATPIEATTIRGRAGRFWAEP